jgi:hypothetical protein
MNAATADTAAFSYTKSNWSSQMKDPKDAKDMF